MNTMIALTGLGYDIHRFAEAPRPLMLGGVHIPSARGLDGHSDADVLCHGRCGRPAGRRRTAGHRLLVPSGDPACKDISSLDIVANGRFPDPGTRRPRGQRGFLPDCGSTAHFSVSGADEKRSGFRTGHFSRRVGVKATTNEQLGALGRREGIAAFAVASILMPEEEPQP